MRLLTVFLVLAAMAASTAIVFQRRALHEVKSETAALLDQISDKTPQPSEDTNSQGELDRLRAETRDLLKLRNEVRQLRSQAPALARVRAENAVLKQAVLYAAANPAATAPAPEGFVAREALADAGLATPEAAAQTFFRAMRDGDVPRFFQCVSASFRETERLDRLDAESTARFGEQIKESMGGFRDFSVVERKDVSPEKVVLSLRSSASPSVMRLTLRKVGNDWAVDLKSLEKPF